MRSIQTARFSLRSSLRRKFCSTNFILERQSNRIDFLTEKGIEPFPRFDANDTGINCDSARIVNSDLVKVPLDKESNETFKLFGRIKSIRRSSSRLAFIELLKDFKCVQIVVNISKVTIESKKRIFQELLKVLQVGDVIEAEGYINRTISGELSLFVESKFRLLAPCLHDLPNKPWKDQEARFSKRHIDLMVNKDARRAIIGRNILLQSIRNFLTREEFIEVETPILGLSAGGAIAKPFFTNKAESINATFYLRCAPELSLKQLVISGFDKIFEIGKVFRNEGCDNIHNPEFTSIEVYQAFSDLNAFKKLTIDLFQFIANSWIKEPFLHIDQPHESSQSTKSAVFDLSKPLVKSLDFIQEIESEIGISLPILVEDNECVAELEKIFQKLNLHLPKIKTVSRMLDNLFEEYLLPKCKGLTFIENHPAVMSPLAKSYTKKYAPKTQLISSRFEVYYNNIELINSYEEENSSSQQALKFAHQQRTKKQFGDSEIPDVDINYLNCLEWGLPPTTGLGIGIDRLLMILLGASKINEVLAFGSVKKLKHGTKLNTVPHQDIK